MTKTLQIVSATGAESGEFSLQDQWLESEKGEQAVHDVIVAYLAGRRAGTASTKTRTEVRGGGAKPYRQKGTGRARAGSIRSPIWRGGGITFGPKPRGFAKNVNKKVRTLALRRAFTERVNEGAVTLLDKLELEDHKSKNIRTILQKLELGENVLLVVADYDQNLLRASANFTNVLLLKAASVNVYQLLRYHRVIFTKEAMDIFVQRLA